MTSHLVLGALGLRLNDLLQHTPVCARGELGDAAAALQVELIHLLGDVVEQHRVLAPDVLLEGADWRPCKDRHITSALELFTALCKPIEDTHWWTYISSGSFVCFSSHWHYQPMMLFSLLAAAMLNNASCHAVRHRFVSSGPVCVA